MLARPWRGTPAQLARCVLRAADALRERMRADELSSVTALIEVSYGDSRTTFDDVEAFVRAASELPAQRVESITAVLGRLPSGAAISLSATKDEGVAVVCESTDEVFAQGSRMVLGLLLDENVPAPRYSVRTTPVWLRWFAGFALAFALGALVVALAVPSLDYTVQDWLFPNALIPVLVCIGLASWRGQVPEPPLTFVAHDEPERRDSSPGALANGIAWLNANPFVSTVMGFLALVASIVIAIATT